MENAVFRGQTLPNRGWGASYSSPRRCHQRKNVSVGETVIRAAVGKTRTIR